MPNDNHDDHGRFASGGSSSSHGMGEHAGTAHAGTQAHHVSVPSQSQIAGRAAQQEIDAHRAAGRMGPSPGQKATFAMNDRAAARAIIAAKYSVAEGGTRK